MPRWSKLKKQIKSLFCDELKERIGIYAVRYKKANDQPGRVWIQLDKKIIFEANRLKWETEYLRLAKEIRQINNCTDFRDKTQSDCYYRAYDQAEEVLEKKHILNESKFYELLSTYINASFEQNLQSNKDLIRILCLLDRRLGKKQLREMVICPDDCDAVKILYAERCRLSCSV